MTDRADKINGLLLDNRFVDWVLDPQSKYGEYWLQWMAADSENALLAKEAASFVLELRKSESEHISEYKTAEMLEFILSHIGEPRTAASTEKMPARRGWYWIAAAVTVLTVGSVCVLSQ